MFRLTLAEIAGKFNAEIRGNPLCQVEKVEPLATATVGALSFLSNPQYQIYLKTTQASAVILRSEYADQCPTNALIVPNPELIFARFLTYVAPKPTHNPGTHPTAVVEQGCHIDPTVTIGPHCVIGEGTKIGSGTVIGAGSIIGSDVQIGADCYLFPRVSLYSKVVIGDRVQVHSGAVIGADGFGLVNNNGQWVKVPQVGSVIIGNDVEIGANTTIDRGALQDTTIGNGVKIDNLVQIAHNVKIGDHTAIAGCTGIAGSAEIGKHCMIGGGACINGHIKITDQVILGGMAAVGQSVSEPGTYSSGIGIQKNSRWRRNMLRFQQLDELAKRIIKLEKIRHGTDGH